MRRISHNEDWSFAPVLNSDSLYPKVFPFSLSYQPTTLKDLMLGRSMEIEFSESDLTVIDRHGLGVFRGMGDRIQYSLQDFIGVAVQYTMGPKPLPSLLTSPLGVSTQLSSSATEAVTLYLMHEDRNRDVLLYFAGHEDEILAQWKFWSQRLCLPQLLVGADGFIDEPGDRMGRLSFKRSLPRTKRFGPFDRRPIFLRIRDMGDASMVRSARGREITARH